MWLNIRISMTFWINILHCNKIKYVQVRSLHPKFGSRRNRTLSGSDSRERTAPSLPAIAAYRLLSDTRYIGLLGAFSGDGVDAGQLPASFYFLHRNPACLKRLANRVIAIKMAENGADFCELYSFFRERGVSDEPFEAFESARRVVRGGRVEGGAPFTKDAIHLGGLLDVHNYLRTAVRTGDVS